MTGLGGMRIMVPESRELDLFGAMLIGEGAEVLRCPLVRIVELEDRAEADGWIDACIAGRFDHLVLLTGDGLRHLLLLCGARRGAFIAALAKLRLITRGPKPARALREIGLTPDLTAPQPTSASILELLRSEGAAGMRMGLQLYPGDGALVLLRGLQDQGAAVFPVTPYRYAGQSETAEVAAAIQSLASGAVDMIAFTASPQVEHLFAVARETGLEDVLRSGLARTPVAAIGPVVAEALQARGIAPALRPESSFHLKPLVRAMAAWRAS